MAKKIKLKLTNHIIITKNQKKTVQQWTSGVGKVHRKVIKNVQQYFEKQKKKLIFMIWF